MPQEISRGFAIAETAEKRERARQLPTLVGIELAPPPCRDVCKGEAAKGGKKRGGTIL